jgi:site-specific DNA-methyltransferase (cytosine-N4-specific)
MCGSGTTLVEAFLMGRQGLGGDVNPIAALVSRAKTLRLTADGERELWDLVAAVESGIPLRADVELPDFYNRDHWFSTEVSVALAWCLSLVRRLTAPDAIALAESALSSIVVGVSRQDSETRWVRRERNVTLSEVLERFEKKLLEHLRKSMDLASVQAPVPSVWRGNASALPLASSSVDLVVTSPPYANSHDYYLYNKLRMFWLGHDVPSVQEAEFGSRNKHSDKKMPINHYLDAMVGVLSESARVIKPGKRVCVVVGDAIVRGEFFNMGVLISQLGESVGLLVDAHHEFSQQRYTKAFTRGFGTKLQKSTHVLVLARPV